MPEDEDKYPQESDRRRFVKGVVGSAALVGLGATGAVSVDTLTSPTGAGGGLTVYKGLENTAGPAPRGMPQIPIEIDDEGYLKGLFPEYESVEKQGRTVQVAETEIGGVTYGAQWFQYCGVQSYKGLQPDANQDDYFRYATNPPYEWQKEAVDPGAKVHVDDFSDYETWGNGIGKSGIGKPAAVTWRSKDIAPRETIPALVIRSKRVEEMASGGGDEWVSASTQDGFIANMNKCTHFCCVPGFKATEQSAQFESANEIYCPCHQSVYDPFSIVEKQFTALPRPSE